MTVRSETWGQPTCQPQAPNGSSEQEVVSRTDAQEPLLVSVSQRNNIKLFNKAEAEEPD